MSENVRWDECEKDFIAEQYAISVLKRLIIEDVDEEGKPRIRAAVFADHMRCAMSRMPQARQREGLNTILAVKDWLPARVLKIFARLRESPAVTEQQAQTIATLKEQLRSFKANPTVSMNSNELFALWNSTLKQEITAMVCRERAVPLSPVAVVPPSVVETPAAPPKPVLAVKGPAHPLMAPNIVTHKHNIRVKIGLVGTIKDQFEQTKALVHQEDPEIDMVRIDGRKKINMAPSIKAIVGTKFKSHSTLYRLRKLYGRVDECGDGSVETWAAKIVEVAKALRAS